MNVILVNDWKFTVAACAIVGAFAYYRGYCTGREGEKTRQERMKKYTDYTKYRKYNNEYE